jgi:hypothetical protein
MDRGKVGAAVVACLAAAGSLALASPAGASGLSVKVSPSKGLTNGKTVTVAGTGLPKSADGTNGTWFADECNALVTGKLTTADTPHCDVSLAKVLKVTKHGTFSVKFKVATGTVGDGACGTAGHLTCVIGIGTASGQGTVVKITFKSPPS